MNESTNFGLKTTQDTDQWRNTLDYHNENMGVIDAVLAKNQDALGIIVDGNKAAVSATTGQYIILRNSTITGKTDGLYTAAKSIPANTAIDGTYLTAVSGGGLNALNNKMTEKSEINFTISNLGSTYFSVRGNQSKKMFNGSVYSYHLLLDLKGVTIQAGEYNIGAFSSATYSVSGVAVYNSDSSLFGIVNIAPNGNVYMRIPETKTGYTDFIIISICTIT